MRLLFLTGWWLWVLVVVFFFFKQKTTYEVRISGWNSDVCSSDLAELAVVEQKTAEIALERLDADADRVEVVAVAVVAEMLVDEGFLHTDEMVEAMALLRGTHVEHAPFGHVDIVDVIGEGQAIFDVGRLEGGIALDQRSEEYTSELQSLMRISYGVV